MSSPTLHPKPPRGISFVTSAFMREDYFTINFKQGGILYEGVVTPSEKLQENGLPKSYHVVLNNVLFGNVSYNHTKWAVDEQRPQELTDLVGECINKHSWE